ncbi:hypothetical protein NP233_g5889 [Leucocoprinus birnbaumii]|uniref:Uncharacterized protein n=1 Tax=Leucocoprinus birnbaumii TaxID=56174 RepID=A0AAD5YQI5_9AGAR|nr:hypothetical protein NP233_g5889 [Leucocoprinus birnbaumii]
MWSSSRYRILIIIVPSLAHLGFLVMEGVTTHNILFGYEIFTKKQSVVIDVVRRSLTLLTGLFVTSLICTRIALVQRKHIQIMGSGSLESVKIAFAGLLPFIQTIAYLLVEYRVSTGRAWKKDTEEKLTSLQWNREGQQGQQTMQLTTTRSSIHISGDVSDARL